MSPKLIAILFGGLIHAVLFATTGIFQKLSAKAGLSPGYILIGVGATIIATGILYNLYDGEIAYNTTGMGYAVLFGFAWAIAICMINIVLFKYNGNISRLAPLHSLSIIIAAVLALIILRESDNINTLRIIIAEVIISIGIYLTATA
ncbi:hypothetical protein JW960_24095 [candidate division KSB1 bacterium]|nr:hypothetical protein [candidate division KSB1 bacterium]